MACVPIVEKKQLKGTQKITVTTHHCSVRPAAGHLVMTHVKE